MSVNYEILRYGRDKIKQQTQDANTQGKLSKLIVTPDDLIDPSLPPTIDNFRFELIQIKQADLAMFYNSKTKTTINLKDFVL